MVTIPGGSFQMGGAESEAEANEKPVHSVNVKGFAISKFEVTQGQWKAVMGSNPSKFKDCGDNCPVENVSWNEAQDYIQKLNARSGQKYRLPTEAEWEYACRGGQHHKHCGSEDANAVALYGENSGGKTQAVGQKAANGYGLHDMSGNVWEWVQDGWHSNYQGAPDDGSEWTTGADTSRRVIRGDSYYYLSKGGARAAQRGGSSPYKRSGNFGFRIARTIP
jgi:formylglycine-generating enzyme required for sulfatase activity